MGELGQRDGGMSGIRMHDVNPTTNKKLKKQKTEVNLITVKRFLHQRLGSTGDDHRIDGYCWSFHTTKVTYRFSSISIQMLKLLLVNIDDNNPKIHMNH